MVLYYTDLASCGTQVPTEHRLYNIVQTMYADAGEVLVSFDPAVLEWYPSVVIPLPQHGLFEYLLAELLAEVSTTTEDEVYRVAGDLQDREPRIWTEKLAESPAVPATYATQTGRRLTLDVPLQNVESAKSTIGDWLSKHSNS